MNKKTKIKQTLVIEELKKLPDVIIVKNLGLMPYGNNNKTIHKALVQCTKCNALKHQALQTIKKCKHTKCRTCINIETGETRRLAAAIAFEAKATLMHKQKYSYNNVIYKSAMFKVYITCNIHGDFNQKPNDHLSGEGCPKCSKGSDFDTIYLWQINDTNIYKIGVTSARLKEKRIKAVAAEASILTNIPIIPTILAINQTNKALEIEQNLLKLFTTIPIGIPIGMNGRNEFRVLTQKEILEALKQINA